MKTDSVSSCWLPHGDASRGCEENTSLGRGLFNSWFRELFGKPSVAWVWIQSTVPALRVGFPVYGSSRMHGFSSIWLLQRNFLNTKLIQWSGQKHLSEVSRLSPGVHLSVTTLSGAPEGMQGLCCPKDRFLASSASAARLSFLCPLLNHNQDLSYKLWG